MKKITAAVLTLLLTLLLFAAQAGSLTGTAFGAYTKPSCSHHWELQNVKKEPTCSQKGSAVYKCSKCGKKTTKTMKAAHTYGEWEVLQEATCKAYGKEKAVCQVCGKVTTRKIARGAHVFGEWVILREAEGSHTGKRVHTCAICGKKFTQTYYPAGTLWIDGEWTAEEIEVLQTELKRLGYFNGKITGEFNKATVAALKKFQKKNGLKADGVAWPDTLLLLGINQTPGTPIVRKDTKGSKLKLEVEMISPAQETYVPGDVITFEWTLTNNSKKNDAVDVLLYTYLTPYPKKKTDEEVAQPETLAAGENIKDTFEYVVSPEDADKGTIRLGFVARGKLKKTAVTSNTVGFRIEVEEE